MIKFKERAIFDEKGIPKIVRESIKAEPYEHYRPDKVKITELEYIGIPFINSPWKVEVKCPICGKVHETTIKVDRKNKTIETEYRFCSYCGVEYDWSIG